MKIRQFPAVLCAALFLPGAAFAQTAPDAPDAHGHSASGETVAGAADSSSQGPAMPNAGSGSAMMMSPEMMQMMMQMMAQHHVAGSTPGAGMADGMAGAVGQGAVGQGGDVIFGLAPAATPETTPDLVRGWLQAQLDRLKNPRLTLGTIEKAADGSIIAEIRTVDGALVQRLSFNRYPGFVRQID